MNNKGTDTVLNPYLAALDHDTEQLHGIDKPNRFLGIGVEQRLVFRKRASVRVASDTINTPRDIGRAVVIEVPQRRFPDDVGIGGVVRFPLGTHHFHLLAIGRGDNYRVFLVDIPNVVGVGVFSHT